MEHVSHTNDLHPSSNDLNDTQEAQPSYESTTSHVIAGICGEKSTNLSVSEVPEEDSSTKTLTTEEVVISEVEVLEKDCSGKIEEVARSEVQITEEGCSRRDEEVARSEVTKEDDSRRDEEVVRSEAPKEDGSRKDEEVRSEAPKEDGSRKDEEVRSEAPKEDGSRKDEDVVRSEAPKEDGSRKDEEVVRSEVPEEDGSRMDEEVVRSEVPEEDCSRKDKARSEVPEEDCSTKDEEVVSRTEGTAPIDPSKLNPSPSVDVPQDLDLHGLKETHPGGISESSTSVQPNANVECVNCEAPCTDIKTLYKLSLAAIAKNLPLTSNTVDDGLPHAIGVTSLDQQTERKFESPVSDADIDVPEK